MQGGGNLVNNQTNACDNNINSSAENSSEDTTMKQSAQIALLGNILLYVGESIILFTKSDWLQLLAAYIKLTGGALEIVAAKLESNETVTDQKLPEGTITPIGKQKIIGAVISEIGGIILTNALQKEIAAKPSKPANAPVLSPFIGGVGAIIQ